MSHITRLSDCKTVDDFKDFATKLKSDSESSGRSFVYIEDGKSLRAYTMNQIVHRFSKCVKKSNKALGQPAKDDAWKSDRQQLRSNISDSVDVINELNANADQVDGRSMLGLRKKLGNAWYSFTHWGFKKERALLKIQKNNPVDILPSITNATQQIFDDFLKLPSLNHFSTSEYNDFIASSSKHYSKIGSALHEALALPEAQSIILQNKQLTLIFQMNASINSIESFTNANLEHLCQKLVNSAQKYVDKADNKNDRLANILKDKFIKAGLHLQDNILNPTLYHNDLLRPGILAYCNNARLNTLSVRDHHLNFVVQKVVNELDAMISQSGDSPEALADLLDKAFRKEGLWLNNLIKAFFKIGVIVLNPYNIQRNDSRLQRLFLDIRIKEALSVDLGNASAFTKEYTLICVELVVKDADILVNQANGSLEDLGKAIIAKCQLHGLSLKNIVSSTTLLNDDRLRPALVHYAKQNQIEGFLEAYEEFICQRIVSNEHQYKIKYNSLNRSLAAKALEEEIIQEGLSLKEILSKPSTREIFIKSDFFRPYLVVYAKDHGLDEFLNSHLESIVKKMISKKQTIISFVTRQVIDEIKLYLEFEGRTLEELFNNDRLVNELSRADVFISRALSDYRNQNTVILSRELTQDDFGSQKKKDAERLGQEHAQVGNHLVQKLGLTDAYQTGNKATLKKAVILIIRKNHSDKNSDNDQDLVVNATCLLDLITSGNLESYMTSYNNSNLIAALNRRYGY